MTPIRNWPQKRPPIQAAPVAGPWLRLWTPTLSLLLLLILELVSWAFQLIFWVHPCPSINPLMLLVTGVCFSYLYLRTPTDSTNPLLTNLNHNAATCWINCFMSVPQVRPCPPGNRNCIVLWGDTVNVPQTSHHWKTCFFRCCECCWVMSSSCQPLQLSASPETAPCPRLHPHIGFWEQSVTVFLTTKLSGPSPVSNKAE